MTLIVVSAPEPVIAQPLEWLGMAYAFDQARGILFFL
jgi:hypothetical protein